MTHKTCNNFTQPNIQQKNPTSQTSTSLESKIDLPHHRSDVNKSKYKNPTESVQAAVEFNTSTTGFKTIQEGSFFVINLGSILCFCCVLYRKETKKTRRLEEREETRSVNEEKRKERRKRKRKKNEGNGGLGTYI